MQTLAKALSTQRLDNFGTERRAVFDDVFACVLGVNADQELDDVLLVRHEYRMDADAYWIVIHTLLEAIKNDLYIPAQAPAGQLPAFDQLYAQLERQYCQYPLHPKSPELLLRFPRLKLSPKTELDAWRFLAKNFPSERVPLDELVSAFARHVERLDDTTFSHAADPATVVSPTALQTVVQAHSANLALLDNTMADHAADPTTAVSPTALQAVVQALSLKLALLAKPSTREWPSPAFTSDHNCNTDGTWTAIPGVAVTVPGFPRDAYVRIVVQTTIHGALADASWHFTTQLRATPALAAMNGFARISGGRVHDSSVMTDVVRLPASAAPTTFEVFYRTKHLWAVRHDQAWALNRINVFFEDWA
eukprot:TRINITY_DN1761_c0_g2_i1.p1 TRINITY_DN1761_c0_g2~~TRINITY_DN1761_c0_g2_i1.p1  ORF type:complete len:363 (-),score=58.49 TRINITY_DN1761_c0_g2_i1:18-1106(-)